MRPRLQKSQQCTKVQWPIHKRAPQTECSQRNHYPKGNHSLRPQSRSPTRRPNREAEGAQILEELSRKARIVICTSSHSESRSFRARNQCLTTALVALSVRRAHGEDAASAALLGSPRPSPPHLPCEPARSFYGHQPPFTPQTPFTCPQRL